MNYDWLSQVFMLTKLMNTLAFKPVNSIIAMKILYSIQFEVKCTDKNVHGRFQNWTWDDLPKADTHMSLLKPNFALTCHGLLLIKLYYEVIQHVLKKIGKRLFVKDLSLILIETKHGFRKSELLDSHPMHVQWQNASGLHWTNFNAVIDYTSGDW